MKRPVMLAALAVGLSASGAARAAEQTVTLAVGNLYCASCSVMVQKSLSAVPGVSKVIVSFKDKSAAVTFDDQKTSTQVLIAATTTAGFPSKLAAAPTSKP